MKVEQIMLNSKKRAAAVSQKKIFEHNADAVSGGGSKSCKEGYARSITTRALTIQSPSTSTMNAQHLLKKLRKIVKIQKFPFFNTEPILECYQESK